MEQCENQIKLHESFITSMDANNEKLNTVLQFSDRLMEDGHYAQDKIKLKSDNIQDRWVAFGFSK